MNQIWITSDLHLGHRNILSFERNNLNDNGFYFNTIEEYNDMVIRRINSSVDEQDILYILGDFGFGTTEEITKWVSQINGYKVLILGNHDHFSVKQALEMGFNEAYQGPYFLKEGKGMILMAHEPPIEAKENPYIAYCFYGHLHDMVVTYPNYINVNVDINHYKPINLSKYIQKAPMKAKKRDEEFLHEWYADNIIVYHGTRKDIVLTKGSLIDKESSISLRNALAREKANRYLEKKEQEKKEGK